MRQEKFYKFFENVSKQLSVSMIAKEIAEEKKENLLKVEEALPIFDSIDLLEKYDCLVLPDQREVKREYLPRRPLRILFFIYLTELESALYRIQEWSGRERKELNETNMNDLIRDLLEDKNLFAHQNEYGTRGEFKEELKAVSSIRNLIVHVNKKLEMETNFETIVKRKKQMEKLYRALSQIMVGMEKEKKNEKK